MANKKALILVDLQNDFCKGGSLAAPGADEIIPIVNQLQPHFELVIATKDWHPRDHVSFAASHTGKQVGDVIEVDGIPQVLWPIHCVQNSKGSEFHPELDTTRVKKTILKGSDKNIDSYSAFFDNEHLKSTGLADYLRSEQVKDIYITGLVTEYCVKLSSIDAIKSGFNAYVIEDACRGVGLHPGDIPQAIQEMKSAGVKMVNAKDILSAS